MESSPPFDRMIAHQIRQFHLIADTSHTRMLSVRSAPFTRNTFFIPRPAPLAPDQNWTIRVSDIPRGKAWALPRADGHIFAILCSSMEGGRQS
jgi:hypothetical protein